MSGHPYKYIHPELNLEKLNSEHKLLLQIYADSFSYAVTHGDQLLAWAEDCGLSLMDDPGNEHELLAFDYKNVVTGLQPSGGFTLIPSLLFSEDKITDFARYLDVKPNEKVLAQPLDEENHIIYKVNESVADTAEIFGLQKAVFINKGWIEAIAKSGPTKHDLYLNVDKKQVSILHFDDEKLRFYNTFNFSNPDELAYYAAYVAQELHQEPRHLNIAISGDIEVADENGKSLARFFNGVEENYLSPLTLPNDLLPHNLLALTALSLCVSSEVH
jgi:hypothetical protein